MSGFERMFYHESYDHNEWLPRVFSSGLQMCIGDTRSDNELLVTHIGTRCYIEIDGDHIITENLQDSFLKCYTNYAINELVASYN